jgi:2-hydroxychromene-2-carboxylate isomerase
LSKAALIVGISIAARATRIRWTHSCNRKAELIANTEAAAKRGAFGVPTFFVGEEMFWGKERLGQVEAALTKS